MKSMRLHRLAALADEPEPLLAREIPDLEPARTCGVCRTELDDACVRTAEVLAVAEG